MNTHSKLALLAAAAVSFASCEGLGLEEDWNWTGSSPTAGSHAPVRVNGSTLDAAQVATLEATYGVQAVPGDYWYDARSGLFGIMGQPSSGMLYPGHDFGPLPSDASRGRSGVMLNGRELHATEVATLGFYTGGIAPGSYWLDAQGNLGNEGDPYPAVNLYLIAQLAAQQGGQGTGGQGSVGQGSGGGWDNTWSSMYGSGNYNADNSSGYVHIPSTTGGSGVFVSY